MKAELHSLSVGSGNHASWEFLKPSPTAVSLDDQSRTGRPMLVGILGDWLLALVLQSYLLRRYDWTLQSHPKHLLRRCDRSPGINCKCTSVIVIALFEREM